MMDQLEIAWLAGLYEGEGNLGRPRVGRRNFILQIRMTDEDIIRRCHAITGTGKIYGPYIDRRQPHFKPTWVWSVCKKKEQARIMLAIYPLLGDRRKSQFAEATEWIDRPDRRERSIIHGTDAGYQKEAKIGMVCISCREANRKAQQQRRQRRKEAPEAPEEAGA